MLRHTACAYYFYSKVEKYVDSCLAKQSSPPLARIVSSPL